MKQISLAINALKMVAKYGAYFIVIFDIISYAVDKFEDLQKEQAKKETGNDK